MAGHIHNPFQGESAEYEEIPCDLCGSRDAEALGFAHGSQARAVICRRCGLIYISPRMTKPWYERYYQVEYRGADETSGIMDRLFEKGFTHGRALANVLRPHLQDNGFTPLENAPRLTAGFGGSIRARGSIPRASSLTGFTIEVGSSTGGVLAGVRDIVGGSVLGIEPSAREAAYARAHDVPTEVTLIEDADAKGVVIAPADQILSSQSLNHFLSPRFFFSWAWRHLKPSGRLIIEVKNFRQQVRRSGRLGNSIQIDHVYMFTPETLKEYLTAAGFRVRALMHDEKASLGEIHSARAEGLPGYQIRAVAEKEEREPFRDVERWLDPSAYGSVRASFTPANILFHHFFRYRRLRELFRI